MNHVIVHYNEISLKGKNRNFFERRLCDNIKESLNKVVTVNVRRIEGRIICRFETSLDSEQKQAVRGRLSRVFGISSFSSAVSVAPKLDEIVKVAVSMAKEKRPKSFAVRAKRADKNFATGSSEMNKILGKEIIDATGCKVDLTDPELTVEIEVTKKAAYVYVEKIDGPGGLPVGTAGKVIALLSGGIDSPVAAWKVIKRGCETAFLHFHSYPHTSKASIEKVRELAKIVGAYQPETKIYFVSFAEAQRQIVMACLPKYRVLLYRRLMMRIACEIAKSENALALVTGESIGQVASQTVPNISAVEESSELPIFRPLIGDDKNEIIDKARKIGTFDISIRPHDDCCSLFVPKNPSTNASIFSLKAEEEKLNLKEIIEKTLENVEIEIL